MGGMLAFEVIQQAPERVERLALMDTTARADGPKHHAIRTRQIKDVTAGNLGKIDVPTLVLCGDQDRLCPPRLHEELHTGIKSSTFVTIKNAEHLPTLENPKATTEALETWLRAPI